MLIIIGCIVLWDKRDRRLFECRSQPFVFLRLLTGSLFFLRYWVAFGVRAASSLAFKLIEHLIFLCFQGSFLISIILNMVLGGSNNVVNLRTALISENTPAELTMSAWSIVGWSGNLTYLRFIGEHRCLLLRRFFSKLFLTFFFRGVSFMITDIILWTMQLVGNGLCRHVDGHPIVRVIVEWVPYPYSYWGCTR